MDTDLWVFCILCGKEFSASVAGHKFRVSLEPIGLTPRQLKEKQGFAREIVESGVTVFRQK